MDLEKRMQHRRPAARREQGVAALGFAVEHLEFRQFLSASPQLIAKPATSAIPQIATAMIDGFKPAEIQKAYGFDQVTFGTDEVPGDGSGQTIAIVDAFDNPKILADLRVFDRQFGLPNPPSFKKVGQTGSTTLLPAVDPSWAQEIALDVEWAHAIAPKANILLVEANSDNLSDLMAAVDTARKTPGVTVVSMSWGMSEFANQTKYDKYFSTPKGHVGITFVAASGDDGAGRPATWPSVSTNVLSVGGTTLTLNNATGAYSSESAWRSSSGGTSRFEFAPAYQDDVQNGTRRIAPDVAYNANPNTGFAIYDSLSFDGDVGWQVFGGTSAGTPQWAALIAIANQGRVLQGGKALGGATITLPTLYSLYDDADIYSTSYHDVTTGGASGGFGWWHGHASQAVAKAGYDTVTGLGSPQAEQVIAALLGAKGGAAVAKPAPAATAAAAAKITARPALSRVQDIQTLAPVKGEFAAVTIKAVITEVTLNERVTTFVNAAFSNGALLNGLAQWRTIDHFAGLETQKKFSSLSEINRMGITSTASPFSQSRGTPRRSASGPKIAFRQTHLNSADLINASLPLNLSSMRTSWIQRFGAALLVGASMVLAAIRARRGAQARYGEKSRRSSLNF